VINENEFISGAGYGLPNAEITFPISPTKCLYLDRKHTQKYRAVSKKTVQEINKHTAWTAKQFIISHINTKYAENLTKWASKSLQYPKINKDVLINELEKKRIFD
jgi:hypothetical protein